MPMMVSLGEGCREEGADVGGPRRRELSEQRGTSLLVWIVLLLLNIILLINIICLTIDLLMCLFYTKLKLAKCFLQ